MQQNYHTKLQGTGVALVTPFTQKLTIDYEAYEKLIQHVNPWVDYFVIHGTTGEAATTTVEEKNMLLSYLKKYNTQQKPIVCGIGGNHTTAMIQHMEALNLEGVSALLVVTPYYNKPTQEGIYQHYQTIAARAPAPLLLYNVPSRTGVNMEVDTIVRLSALPHIIGIKEASGDLLQCMQIHHQTSKNFLLISGDDLLTLPMMAIGATGVIGVLSNAVPSLFHNIARHALHHDYVQAKKYSDVLLSIHSLMYQEGNPVGIKQLLHICNICQPYVRLPLVKGSEDLQQKIKIAYHSLSHG